MEELASQLVSSLIGMSAGETLCDCPRDQLHEFRSGSWQLRLPKSSQRIGMGYIGKSTKLNAGQIVATFSN